MVGSSYWAGAEVFLLASKGMTISWEEARQIKISRSSASQDIPACLKALANSPELSFEHRLQVAHLQIDGGGIILGAYPRNSGYCACGIRNRRQYASMQDSVLRCLWSHLCHKYRVAWLNFLQFQPQRLPIRYFAGHKFSEVAHCGYTLSLFGGSD